MKKTGKIIGGAGLGLIFLAAVCIGFWQSDFFDFFLREKEEETKTVKIAPAERKVYEIGENIDCDSLIWNFTGTELQSYDNLDNYYKNRENLIPPIEICEAEDYGIFEEEVQYLCIKGTITNTSKYSRQYDFGRMKLYNVFEDGSFEEAFVRFSGQGDCRFISKSGPVYFVQDCSDQITIDAGETVEFEYVIHFLKYNTTYGYDHLYDLYLSTQGLYSPGIIEKVILEEKIHLGIEPKNLGIARTEPENTYDEQRDIIGMKCRQWINPQIRQYQKNGYPNYSEDIEPEERKVEEVTEENIQFEKKRGGFVSQITYAEVTDWEGVKEEAADLTRLEEVADSYVKEGYDKEQLKILLLEINYKRTNDEMEIWINDGMENRRITYETDNCINFYVESYLFTRDEQGKRWIFGTADDWTVRKNSVKGGRTGHINTEWFVEDQTVTLLAAYLLPPEIYNEGALYFLGGRLCRDYNKEEPIIQKISLREQGI